MTKQKQDYITLQNFLKFNGFVQTGGEAKLVIQDGFVKVNGEVEMRRGRKLYSGDKVSYQGETLMIKDVY
ncbi:MULTISPECIES: RNA-binding S4 domain-containing protein [Terrabacteria group]|uniref:RNA-binding S4 domain-containing protein n=1 Tax=Bacillati TaxID=1783272 RepID=UPI001C6F5B11|nr:MULTISPECIES: RNA-binding S4 domain-containing protein [Terrabacteria group]MBW9212502.1 RNA-binding S4 domain-containing protein [Trueperella sp. zg.1013]